MSENAEDAQGDLGFERLISGDIWKGQLDGSNGHSVDGVSVVEPVGPNCAACNDTRWLATEPSSSGQAPILVPCQCQPGGDDKKVRLTTYANLGNLSDRTFKDLKPRYSLGPADPDSLEHGVKVAKEFAKSPSEWLVISGPLRSGKSHIAAAITDQCTRRGTPSKFVTAMQLDEIIRSLDRWSEAEDAESRWNALIDAPILVIDDFGIHLSNARVVERLDQLLTVRAVDPLPTVIVLAKTYDELPDRLRQRLIDKRLCKRRIEIRPRVLADTVAGRVPRNMLEQMTFRTFDTRGASATVRDDRYSLSMALDAAMRFAADPAKWIHFHGPPGVGKTHLAVAIAGHARANGITPTYWRLPELLDRLRDSYSDRTWESLDERLGSVKNAKLLILDDFCPPTMTDWTLEKLYQLVCHRYDSRLPTVSAGQFIFRGEETDEQLARLQGHYERQDADFSYLNDRLLWVMIKSRLKDTEVVVRRLMCAPDYRNRGA